MVSSVDFTCTEAANSPVKSRVLALMASRVRFNLVAPRRSKYRQSAVTINGSVRWGMSLEDRIFNATQQTGSTTMPISEIKTILHQLLLLFDTLHERGVVHGRLSAAELILIGRKRAQRVVVSNPNFAHTPAPPKRNQFGDDLDERNIASVSPNEETMSPQLICCNPATSADDIFAIGCFAATMLTGVAPFTGTSASHRLFLIQFHLGNIPALPAVKTPLFARIPPPQHALGGGKGTLPVLATHNNKQQFSNQRNDTELRDTAYFLDGLLHPSATHRFTAKQALECPFFKRGGGQSGEK